MLVDVAKVFDKMHERDLVSWHTLIDVFCKVGDVRNAYNSFDVNLELPFSVFDGVLRSNNEQLHFESWEFRHVS